MDWDSRSNHLVYQEEKAEAADFNSEEAAVGVVKKAAEDEAKEIEINVRMVLT